MDDREIIPLLYAFLTGMKTYKKACEEVEEYLASDSKKKIDPELESFIKGYQKFQKIFSIAEEFLD